MTAPAPSQLDSNQILPHAYDESTGAIRVESSPQVLEISDTTDSIKIGDGSGSNYAGVTEGGLNVYSVPGISFQTSQYTVGTSAVQITATPLTNRSSISLKATTTSSNIIYVGNSSSVTTSTGYPLNNGDALNIDLSSGHVIYAIASGASQTLSVLELA